MSGTGFGFIEFAIVGVPLLAGTIAVSSCCSGRGCCPHRVARGASARPERARVDARRAVLDP